MTISIEEHKVLHLLAKRKYPFCVSWHVVGNHTSGRIECNICNEFFEVENLHEHGLHHLKESKLLSFI